MRLSVEDSTEMPLLLTDLVKVVRPGAVTPVAAGMLMSRPTAQQLLRRKEQEKVFYCLIFQDRDHSLFGEAYRRDPQLP